MAYQKLQASRALAVVPSDTVNIPNPAMLAIDSTATGAAALKLIDANGDFINKRVKIGDIIYSTVAGIASKVTGVDSSTQLSVTTAIPNARPYQLYSQVAPQNGCILYVGLTGDLKVNTVAGDTVTFKDVQAGSFIPVQVTRVWDSSSAADIVALW